MHEKLKIIIFFTELGLGDFPYFPVVPVTVKVRHLRILCLFAAILSRIPLSENHISNSDMDTVCLFVWKTFEETVLTSSWYSIENPICYRKTSLGKKIILVTSVADPDPGSAAFLTPWSGMIFPDPGPRIPDPIFYDISESLTPIFGVKNA